MKTGSLTLNGGPTLFYNSLPGRATVSSFMLSASAINPLPGTSRVCTILYESHTNSLIFNRVDVRKRHIPTKIYEIIINGIWVAPVFPHKVQCTANLQHSVYAKPRDSYQISLGLSKKKVITDSLNADGPGQSRSQKSPEACHSHSNVTPPSGVYAHQKPGGKIRSRESTTGSLSWATGTSTWSLTARPDTHPPETSKLGLSAAS